jgi:hypothetical protein
MPAKGDGITKRKDGRYMARYTVHTADGPKRKTIYGIKYKDVEKKLNAGRRGAGDHLRCREADRWGVPEAVALR